MAAVVRSWAGERLGFQEEIDRARAAAAMAQQYRDAGQVAAAQAFEAYAAAENEQATAEAIRDLALAQARAQEQIMVAQVTADLARREAAAALQQPQAPAQDLAFQTAATAVITEMAGDLNTHDIQLQQQAEEIRKTRAVFYRETLRNGYNRAKNITMAWAGGGLLTGITIIGGIIGGGVAVIYERKYQRIGRALSVFNGLIDSGGDPKTSFWHACALHKVDDDDLGIEDDVKRGFWKHPY